MITILGLTRRFRGKTVLDRLDLEFERGRTHVLLGSSGSGKTTLLRLLLGFLEPDEGEIRIDGRRVSAETQSMIRDSIGYVVQDGGLFPHLTAHRNAELPARARAWAEAAIARRLGELAMLTGTDDRVLGLYPRQLSGGQKQRVGLMRALFLDPPLLLLDEPLAALDPIVRFHLQAELKRIFASLGKTVVIVTHDLAEAAYFGDTITLLREGRVVQRGRFEDLVARPTDPYVTEFISASRLPAMWPAPGAGKIPGKGDGGVH